MKYKDVYPIIFLTIVVAGSVITLAVTDSVTRERIEQEKIRAIVETLSEQFPDMTDFVFDEAIEVYTVYADETGVDENIIGYAFEAEGSGYGGAIEILVTLQDLETMNGISIIGHMETPGLGAKIVESSFTDQFSGIAVSDVALRRDDGQIDAISGATISSSAVVKAVYETAVEKIELLKEEA